MAFAIIRRGVSKEGYIAVPEEGSSFFISPEQLYSLGLHVDQELSEAEFAGIQGTLEGLRCRVKALALLTTREHSRFELRSKLMQKGFSTATLDKVLDGLESEGLLSDRRFAEQFVLSRQRKNPEGRFILQNRLMERGVSRQTVAQVLDGWFADTDAVESAVALAIRKLAQKKDAAVLEQELRKKGFTLTEIRHALHGDD
ncbi:MAG: regulatory protein RecX [Sphaerochaetaceae bacterium]